MAKPALKQRGLEFEFEKETGARADFKFKHKNLFKVPSFRADNWEVSWENRGTRAEGTPVQGLVNKPVGCKNHRKKCPWPWFQPTRLLTSPSARTLRRASRRSQRPVRIYFSDRCGRIGKSNGCRENNSSVVMRIRLPPLQNTEIRKNALLAQQRTPEPQNSRGAASFQFRKWTTLLSLNSV